MKKSAVLMLFMVMTWMIISCGATVKKDYLAYQDNNLAIDATFLINDEVIEATVDLEAPQYDEDGRMLARSAKLTLGGNSIISGVSFEFEGGTAYVVSGVLKIPVDDGELLSGITDILSLFSISKDSFYEAKDAEIAGVSCKLAVYTEGATDSDGGNRVHVYIDEKTGFPFKIDALIGAKTITADINDIHIE